MSKTLVNILIERPLITLQETETISSAVEKLTKYNIGAIPIINEAKELTGILSERDIVKALAKMPFSQLYESSITELMTSPVISCDKSILSDSLMELMTKNKIRHVPILEKKNPIGIVSIGDVVKRLLEKFQHENQLLREYVSG
tara:strand:- start:431 stop:862 length:432 start_codon:yes stop_codon:yes gene_type:complete